MSVASGELKSQAPMPPLGKLEEYYSEIRQALRIRKTEQRLLELFRQGKLFGTVHTCIGQEFVAVAVARALKPQDTVFSNHRGHGHYLACGGGLAALFGEMMGKASGACGGRGGSQHLHRTNYYSNGIQGGIVPVATGLALAHKREAAGAISVVFIGDGTLGEGAVYESMNMASKWDLPLLIVCENNSIAQSTSQTQTLAGDICLRARAFGIDTRQSNTWDWPTLLEDMERSVDFVRANSRPLFHRVDTFRLMAHSKGDDTRPAEFVQAHWDRDPLVLLEKADRDDPLWQAWIEGVEREIDEAVADAEAAAGAELPAVCVPTKHGEAQWVERPFPRERVVQSIQRGLRESLREFQRLVLLGEDIESPYGGAFKCTAGLSEEFPGRVLNTPISEAALAGIGNGLALRGWLPVVEIMFGDFLTLAMDQWINHAAKFRFMYGNEVKTPVVLRTPMGGRRGYGATHSQCLEKHFLGVPDTQVLCLHHRYSPAQLYRDLFLSIDRPTLVIENKTLYGQYCSSDPPPGFRLCFEDSAVFPTARLKPSAPWDLTVVAMGGMSIEAEEAVLRLFAEEEIICDLFLPTQLYPFDVGVLEESLNRSRRLLVVEEGQGFVSMSSEILAQVAERFSGWGVTCRRLTAAPMAIPAARPIERQCLPGTDEIIQAALDMVCE